MPAKYLDKYNDTLLFLVLIPLINTINYHLTYSRIRWDWYTITTYLIDTVQGYIAWWLIRKVILAMDQSLPYAQAPVKRIVYQIVLTNVVAQGFIILATEIINALFTDAPLPSGFYTYNLFIFFIWILVINGVYIGIYFYDQWGRVLSLREKDREIRSKGVKVQLGKTVKTIPFKDILAFYVEEGVTYLMTIESKSYILDKSLSKIMEQLPTEYFYRLNRKYIVHRSAIQGYQRGMNGKLNTILNPFQNLPPEIVISRTTAPHFKKWFQANLT